MMEKNKEILFSFTISSLVYRSDSPIRIPMYDIANIIDWLIKIPNVTISE